MTIAELERFIGEEGGVTTSSRLQRAGFSPGLIAYAYGAGRIDRLTRGVYCTPDVLDDDFAAVTARWRKCVISHGSALYLLGLSDRVPPVLDVTVPYGYNPKSLAEEFRGIRIHRVDKEHYALGLSKARTPMGNLVSCFSAERTVADIIRQRARGGVDAQLIRNAIRGYFSRPGRNLSELARMCKALGVEKELRIYLEVLG